MTANVTEKNRCMAYRLLPNALHADRARLSVPECRVTACSFSGSVEAAQVLHAVLAIGSGKLIRLAPENECLNHELPIAAMMAWRLAIPLRSNK
jgi:hypothetical protein